MIGTGSLVNVQYINIDDNTTAICNSKSDIRTSILHKPHAVSVKGI